jgi:hypothetical protein
MSGLSRIEPGQDKQADGVLTDTGVANLITAPVTWFLAFSSK